MGRQRKLLDIGSRLGWLCAYTLLGASAALAQVDTGTILGTVKDPSGGVIPGAAVTLVNQGTGLRLATKTDSSGGYVFTPIRIGTYTVQAQFRGFRQSIHRDVLVQVTQQVVVNFTLSPGAVTQTVQVTGAPPQLQTQNASVGQVVSQREINDMPLNGRNYTFLAQLSAGVTSEPPTGRGLEENGSFTANGNDAAENDYILDGIDNNNDSVDFLNGAAYAILPPVDAIAEFKVQTSDYSAQFGRAAGGVINATTKSGANQLHGDAWEFLRNSGVDAANFFENSANEAKGEFRMNQFGFTLGGPITIPHVYNGKDKTFFFVDYQATRIRQASPFLETVPTMTERGSGYTDLSQLITDQTGTRSDVLGRSFPLGTVLDPATTRTIYCGVADPVTGIAPSCPSGTASGAAIGFAREPFPGNQLPAGRLDANAKKLLNLFPEPTAAGLFDNFSSDPRIRNNTNQFDARVDHDFSSRDQMFGRVSYANNPDFVPGPFQGYADGGSFQDDSFLNVSFNGVLSETHTFSPTTINEFRLGYSRLVTTQLQPFANTMGIPAQFGIQEIPQIPQNGGLPYIGISGLSQLGPAAFVPGKRVSDTSQLTENLTKIYGSHTFKGGFEMQHLRFPWFAPAYPRGEFLFDGTYTDVPGQTGGATGLAQMLLLPTTTTVSNGFNNVGGADTVYGTNFTGPDDQRHYYGTYFEDRWKTTPKLTVNLGLRWEFFGQVVERYGAQANFIPSPPGSAQFLIPTQRQSTPLSSSFVALTAKDGIKIAYSNVPGLTNTPLSNFGPRAGIAYQLTPKLVIRAGYGIFYGGFTDIGGSPDIGSNYPFLYNFSFFAPDPAHPVTYTNGALGTLETGLSAVPLSPAFVDAEGLGLEGLQQNYSTPYTMDYNFTVQYQLTPNQTFQAAYVGNQSRHLETGAGLNETDELLPPGANPQLYVPFPDFARSASYVTTEGNNYYNSLQVNFERRFNAGLDFLTNFTWAQCRQDNEDLLGVNGNSSGYRAPYLPNFGIQGDYQPCGSYTPHVFHFSGTYQLPFGSGKRFLRSSSRMVNQALGGWTVNWILSLQDGYPATVGCPISTTANFGCDALLVPGQNMYAGPHDVNDWLNPAAFANPAAATTIGQTNYAPLGGSGNQYLAPGFHRLDFSLFKEFRTSESTHLEFRTEVFNITNTPQFATPAYTDFTNTATFGRITSLVDGANDPRQIQFALKFYW
ncbi:MAG TPA: TonB-dependent receptor [Terriglobia bacterium]|nr:TonB-dependent receptor [Terriglobia bacterium]